MLRSRRTVLLTILYVIVSLILLNGAGWFYYRKAARSLRDAESGLDTRLRSTAGGIAHRLDSFHVAVLRPGDEPHTFFQTTRRMLEEERDDHAVDAIHVLGPDGKVKLSSSARFKIGDAVSLPELSNDTFRAALSGVPGVSPLQMVGDELAKAAAAPVADSEGRVVAVVVVAAATDALTPLRAMSADLLHLLVGIAGMSVVAAVLLSTVLWLTLRALLRDEEALRRSEKLALAGTLAAGVAHEVRNPLGVISGMAELLLERAAPGSAESKVARDIVSEVERVNRVVGDFLDFSRPQPPRARAVRVSEMLSRPLDLLRASLDRRKILVSNDLPANLAPVHADPSRIEQVLLNLFLNARDAMAAGGELRISAREIKGGRIELSVSDTGGGIPAADLSKIFEPFFTTKEHGTGLGLAVAKRIVEEHGGTLGVESRAGRGTTFRIVLPPGKQEA